MRNLTINGERLWTSLMELARIGATAKGGVCRLAATDLDGEARRLFIRWCEEAGCTVAVDQIGNIFARRPGRDPALPPVMTGSHLDTQPTGGQGQRWYELTVAGQEAHAGPTPMPRRRDALVGAARMIDAVNKIGHAHAPYACATVGFVEVSPNSRNTIPGRVFLTVDFRHPEDAVLTAMDQELRAACAAAAATQKLDVEVKEFWYFVPTPFHPRLGTKVREAAAAQGYPHQDIISGAGHDAVYMARVAPTAMIFVPCVGGISHNEIEDAKSDDLTAGCNVLLNAVLDVADSAG